MHPDTPIEVLKNLGPKSAEMLRSIDIDTFAALEKAGPVLVYKILQHRFKGVNLLMLYALYGAVHNKHWNSLSPAEKETLKAAASGPLQISHPEPGNRTGD
ncbi:MAG: TfoX/Sxy family DNA transformation protein [Bacteroidota bacterium]